jgi:penicillin-binding protein 1C
VLIVWIGNFDGSGDDSFVGRPAAGPLFFKIMDAIYPPQDWQVEDLLYADNLNLKRVEVCSNTGDLFEKHCPATEESWFIPGVSPIKSSNIYRNVPINPVTGLRTCVHQPGVTELNLYEFWPSEFLQVFAMAGISLKSPPEYQQRCSLDITSTTGINPVITSPQSSIDYVYRFGINQTLSIPLTANADAGAQKLHWFIGSSYIASSTPMGIVTWNATPGEYEIRVVDDQGRSEVKQFRVISSAN